MDFKTMITEEINSILSEAKSKEKSIADKLEGLRIKLIPSMLKKNTLGDTHPRMYRAVPKQMVSDIIDVPVNDLVLYMLNNASKNNARSLIEYHTGEIFFFIS